MRVLVLHNRYRQSGGEDGVARSEAETLRAYGMEVRGEGFDNEVGGAWRGIRTREPGMGVNDGPGLRSS